MKTYQAWRDTGHLEIAIEYAGGPEAREQGQRRLMNEVRNWRPRPLNLPEMDNPVDDTPAGEPLDRA